MELSWEPLCFSDVVCRHKQLEDVGHRLLDRFKQQYEQKKKRRKEKRNSTKKELREDGNISLPLWLCFVSYAVVTCEMKLLQNYFSLRRRSSE